MTPQQCTYSPKLPCAALTPRKNVAGFTGSWASLILELQCAARTFRRGRKLAIIISLGRGSSRQVRCCRWFSSNGTCRPVKTDRIPTADRVITRADITLRRQKGSMAATNGFAIVDWVCMSRKAEHCATSHSCANLYMLTHSLTRGTHLKSPAPDIATVVAHFIFIH